MLKCFFSGHVYVAPVNVAVLTVVSSPELKSIVGSKGGSIGCGSSVMIKDKVNGRSHYSKLEIVQLVTAPEHCLINNRK